MLNTHGSFAKQDEPRFGIAPTKIRHAPAL